MTRVEEVTDQAEARTEAALYSESGTPEQGLVVRDARPSVNRG